MPNRTTQQHFAIEAHRHVTGIANNSAVYKQKYGTMAHKLPMLIHTAGLAQALAFVEARKEDAHQDLLNHVAITIEEQSGQQLTERSRTTTLSDYMFLTQRTLSALVWYKRFAESILNVAPVDDQDETVTEEADDVVQA